MIQPILNYIAQLAACQIVKMANELLTEMRRDSDPQMPECKQRARNFD